ncbi:MAG TPA: SAM-dependent chlorinase/fluorinase [Pyrinomonadaceae bacterium]|nr:SAM-dependent chlorinase/fluorinase [Pyrinomonadaceae bacterium]
MSLITLLTDFGAADYFVGALKGVILSINARAQIVDLTHEIPAHDIRAGAFTLLAAYESFPKGTIHMAVVDPGVGSARRPLLISTGRYFFVGPDNGLFSYVCEREGNARVFQLTNEKFFRAPVSATFHGRDIFAPVAAALSNGVPPETFGGLVEDYARLAPLAPARGDDGATWSASVIHIDRFGNLVTNITRQELAGERFARGARLEINGRVITSFRRFYAEEAGANEEPEGALFAIWGSAGFLEIAADRASAAQILRAERGREVRVVPLKS